jgi:hypothetical protein
VMPLLLYSHLCGKEYKFWSFSCSCLHHSGDW